MQEEDKGEECIWTSEIVENKESPTPVPSSSTLSTVTNTVAKGEDVETAKNMDTNRTVPTSRMRTKNWQLRGQTGADTVGRLRWPIAT